MAKPNKALNNYIRSLPTDGSAGDINQISGAFLGLPAPVAAPPPPPIPPLIKAPKQSKATQASVGQGVRRPKKGKKKTRLSDLRISRPKVNTSLSVGSGGTGLNIGGY